MKAIQGILMAMVVLGTLCLALDATAAVTASW